MCSAGFLWLLYGLVATSNIILPTRILCSKLERMSYEKAYICKIFVKSVLNDTILQASGADPAKNLIEFQANARVFQIMH